MALRAFKKLFGRVKNVACDDGKISITLDISRELRKRIDRLTLLAFYWLRNQMETGFSGDTREQSEMSELFRKLAPEFFDDS